MRCIDHGKKGTPAGYLRVKHCRRNEYAHRVVYSVRNAIPLSEMGSVFIRHTCANPRCVNPKHLVGITQRNNLIDPGCRQRQVNPPLMFTPAQRRAIKARYVPACSTNGMNAMSRELQCSVCTIWRTIHGT